MKGRGVVALCVSFNGLFRIRDVEEMGLVSHTEEASFNYFVLLLVRLLFNELADLTMDTAGQFDRFIHLFYDDYKDKNFNCKDVSTQARELVESRAGRGTSRDVVVLLVDEIGKLRTGTAELTCNCLGMEVPHLIRSGSCSLADGGSGLGLAIMSAMESSLMLAERSVSGRDAESLDYIPAGDRVLQHNRLLDAMRLGTIDGGVVLPSTTNNTDWSLQLNLDSRVARLRVRDAAEVFVLLGGGVWRAIELLANLLREDPRQPLLSILVKVEGMLVTDSASVFLGFQSLLGEVNVLLRDHVLAATVLPDKVSEEALVLPGVAHGPHDASAAAAADDSANNDDEDAADFAPAGTNDLAGAMDDAHKRATHAKVKRHVLAARVWESALTCRVTDLTWDLAVALGLITANRSSFLTPDMIPLTLIRALDYNRVSPSSNLWRALRDILQVVTVSAEEQRHSKGTVLRAKEKFDWCGWELFLLHWEHPIYAARALRPGRWGAATFAEIYGRRATHQGRGPLLSQVMVDATVERTGVVYLAGVVVQQQGSTAPSLADLLGGRTPEEEMFCTVYKLRKSEAYVDGVCFYRAVNTVPGVVQCGELVAVFLQAKHSTPTAGTTSGQDLQDSLNKLDANQWSSFDDGALMKTWRRRSVFVYACMRQVNLPGDKLSGHQAANSFVLSEDDLKELLGNTIFSIARGLYMLHPPQSSRSPASTRVKPVGRAGGAIKRSPKWSTGTMGKHRSMHNAT